MSAVKRKAVDPAEEPPRGQRQPQISCDSCRKRKLKCDRAEPCSSCAVRGIPCHRQPSARRVGVGHSHSAVPSDDFLRRLQALEEAVFHGERHPGPNLYGPLVVNTPVSPATIATVDAADDRSQLGHTAKTLCETSTSDDLHGPDTRDIFGAFKFAVSPSPIPIPVQGPKLYPTLHDAAPILHDPAGKRAPVPMLPREQALALFQDFADHVFPLLPVIHAPTTRIQVTEFYDQLSRGAPVKPQVAALILSISAISAHLWQPNTDRHGHFASVKEAAQLWRTWRKWAYEILAKSQASDGSTLEGVQAWVLLSCAVLNAEGCPPYFRFLHHCSLTAARELSIHLVDSPRADRGEDRVTREVKRRLWWHIVATDWMLGSMGGPNEGTYSIHPRHMNVRYPRNLNDNDITTWDDSTTAPLNIPTQMSFFLQRIRIGEIARNALDARPPGFPDADHLEDYNTVLALDRLFQQAVMDMPPFFQLRNPFQPDKLDNFQLLGAILHLCLLSRRARLHRPFLLQQQAGTNPLHQQSRDICLQCSRMTVSVATGIIEVSLGASSQNATNESRQVQHTRRRSGLSTHRLGHVINHLFMACTVLAFHAGATSGSDSNPVQHQKDGANDHRNTTAVQTELAHACRLLAILGADSPVAARLLRNLVGLLRRYQVQGVDGDEMLERLEGNEKKEDFGRGATGHAETLRETSALGAADGGLEPVAEDVGVDLDGLWDDLVMGPGDDYMQLFADLDSHCGMA